MVQLYLKLFRNSLFITVCPLEHVDKLIFIVKCPTHTYFNHYFICDNQKKKTFLKLPNTNIAKFQLSFDCNM